MNEAQFLEAWVAMELGLLPDPWQHTSTIACASMNAMGAKKKPSDFYPSIKRKGRDATGKRITGRAAEFEMRRRFGGG